MNHNVGTVDRVIRAVMAIAFAIGAVVAPVSIYARVGLGGIAAVVLLTALAGTCPGYRLMGRSTCPARGSSARS